MRKLVNPVESLGSVEKSEKYREHGTKVRDLVDNAESLVALKKSL